MSKVELWTKSKKIIISIALICAFLGAFWSAGRILIHDIPVAISGYEEVVIECDYRDGNYGEIKYASKTVKKKVTALESLENITSNAVLLFVSVGFLIVYPKYKLVEVD